MSKSSLFTLFLAGILVVMVAELLADDSIVTPQETQVSVVSQETNREIEEAAPTSPIAPLLTFELLARAGFESVSLQRVSFQGVLFELLDLSDTLSMEVVHQNLLKNNAAPIASFFEFQSVDDTTAKDIYGLLLDRFKGQLGATVNETNAFLDGSFYINYLDSPDRAFLVVRANKTVYALTYRKEYHPNIVQLIQLFP